MDAQAVVEGVVAILSAETDAPAAEPDGIKSTSRGTPNGIRSSPPVLRQDTAMDIDPPNGSIADGEGRSDSEAETIVLPGKDGHSPSKVRKSIKHEDKSEDEEMRDAPEASRLMIDATTSRKDDNTGDGEQSGPEAIATSTSTLGKRKRQKKHGIDDNAHLGNSSGLSSVPTSPVATVRSSLSKPAASDSELSKSPSPRSRSRSAVHEKAKSVDLNLPRRKQYASGSGDEEEGEVQTFGQLRGSGGAHKLSRDGRSSRFQSDYSPQKRTRSISPPSRGHKRSISTQLHPGLSHGLSHKKKRVPAPLQSTEYHSDESSASGNSHHRSSRLRNLAAPQTGDSTVSPAKMAPHKKHVNSSGQTFLARACGSGKIENVRQRYEQSPQDLNVADNAENTPLHTAALGGYTDIVKFLLSKGDCEIDCVNVEKETPLHDAVDNSHVEVVKLLLDAGANPSKPNKQGNEPLDLVLDLDDVDNENVDEDERNAAIEMKKAIMAAKQKYADTRRGSEDHQLHDNSDGHMSHPKESPRQTPPAYDSNSLGPTNRKGTARSLTKTKDRNLWKSYTVDELQHAAGEGDADLTNQIMNVNPSITDVRALYNAARGGHDNVLNILFALGQFDPDPKSLEGFPLEQSTPILSAIGKDNHLEVIKLFLGQSKFDPTRRTKGETYYEIAKRRAGPNWQEEERLFKDAFDTYHKTHKSPGKSRSPGLRRDRRETDKDVRKSNRPSEQQPSRLHKRSTESTKDGESSKAQAKSTPATVQQSKEGQSVAKRGPGRPRKDEYTISAGSDRERSPLGPPKPKSHSRISESDAAVMSETEPATKPRRRLMSGKDIRGEREAEKQRRASVASNASGVSVKEKRDRPSHEAKLEKSDAKSSPSVQRTSKITASSSHERDLVSDKRSAEKDRARSIKRDDSKDRLSAIRGESPVKRPRKSETPPRSSMQDVAGPSHSGGPQKRRKLDGDTSSGHKSEITPSSSPEHRTTIPKSGLSRDNTGAKHNPDTKSKPNRSVHKHGDIVEDSKDSNIKDKPLQRVVKPVDAPQSSTSETPVKKPKSTTDHHAKPCSDVPSVSSRAEEEEEEAQKQARIKRDKKEAEAARQKEIEEEVEKKRIEEAKAARLAREQAAREEEEKRQKEEADRKERQRIEDAEAQKRAMEERQALYEQQEKAKREEHDRRRAAAQEQHRIDMAKAEEQRREERLAKLPLLLRWFDMLSDPRVSDIAQRFRFIVGYRHDTIRLGSPTQALGREQWMLNTHVAILLGEKDLGLSRFSAWERIQLSEAQKRGVWATQNGDFTLFSGGSTDLRKQMIPAGANIFDVIDQNKSLFLNLDLFFVKVSEFMYIVPTFPHLRTIEMKVEYRELREIPAVPGAPTQLWRQDPDTLPNQKFVPSKKVYVNGILLKQEDRPMTRVVKEAPPLDNFPRRGGIVRVYPGDPDYETVCKEQGLMTALQSSPFSSTNPQISDSSHPEAISGMTPPRSDISKSVNGGSPHHRSISDTQTSPQLPNGVNGQSVSPPSTTIS